MIDFKSFVVPPALLEHSYRVQDHARQITESRYVELERRIACFRQCGVDLDRMQIVDSHDFSSSTLYVDGIARFTWKLEQPHYGYR